MNPSHRFVIEGWMITELRLSDAPLLIYAILYSFSRHGPVLWSYTNMASYTGIPVSSLRRYITKLIQSGFVVVSSQRSDTHSFAAVRPKIFSNSYTPDSILPASYSQIENNRTKLRIEEPNWLQESQIESQIGEKEKKQKKEGSPVGSPDTHTKCAKEYNNNVNSSGGQKIELSTTATTTKDSYCSWEELLAYARGKSYALEEVTAFYQYYSGNGWKVGRNPMMNWRAALGYWMSHPKQQKAPPTAPPLTDDERRAIKETRQRLADAEDAARAANLADARSEETLAFANSILNKHSKRKST